MAWRRSSKVTGRSERTESPEGKRASGRLPKSMTTSIRCRPSVWAPSGSRSPSGRSASSCPSSASKPPSSDGEASSPDGGKHAARVVGDGRRRNVGRVAEELRRGGRGRSWDG